MSAPAWDWTPETLARLEAFLSECQLTSGPLTTDCSAEGGTLAQICGVTVKLTSFDGGLVPIVFCALTRTK